MELKPERRIIAKGDIVRASGLENRFIALEKFKIVACNDNMSVDRAGIKTVFGQHLQKGAASFAINIAAHCNISHIARFIP